MSYEKIDNDNGNGSRHEYDLTVSANRYHYSA